MFRLVHLSDPHLGPLPNVRLRELASKRILGFVNWHRNRARAMAGDICAELVMAIAASHPDHIAVTGDLVNIALTAELAPARVFLESLGTGNNVTVVPGNHDAYVPGAVRHASTTWSPWMTGDGATAPGAWPFVRRRGALAFVGLSTARATGPFMATGTLGRSQRQRLKAVLAALREEGLFRVVLIHHPPFPGATAWHKRLVDADKFRKIIAEEGAELILHGHTHLPTRSSLPGPAGGEVPVFGVPGASQGPGGRKPPSGFNEFDIEPVPDGWRVTHRLRQYVVETPGYPATRSEDISLGRAPARSPAQPQASGTAGHGSMNQA